MKSTEHGNMYKKREKKKKKKPNKQLINYKREEN